MSGLREWKIVYCENIKVYHENSKVDGHLERILWRKFALFEI